MSGAYESSRHVETCIPKMGRVVLLFTALTPFVSPYFLGEPHPIHIAPDKDLYLRIGKPLELFCILNRTLTPCSASNAKFLGNKIRYYNITEDINDSMPSKTSIVNDTAIRLYDVNPSLGETMYYCILNCNGTFRSPRAVTVGDKPQPVTDFSCVSIEWNNLTCTWTPSNTYMKTSYYLTLRLPGRAGRNPFPCPNMSELKKYTCVFANQYYHEAVENFIFNLTGTNPLGSVSQPIRFDHFNNVVPAAPVSLRHVSNTTNSCIIAWDTPRSFTNFPSGLQPIIKVKSERDFNTRWKEYNTSGMPLTNKTWTYNIEGLSFANTNYDVRVYFKNPNSSLRSHHASIIFRTSPTIPGAAPLTTTGCFEMVPINNTFMVVIYWRTIEDHLRNGDLFEYAISCQRNGKYDCSSSFKTTTSSHAKFIASKVDSYNFTVYSRNRIGRSLDSSYIYVPKYNSVERPSRPTKTTYGDGVYGLTWSYKGHTPPDSYTVFYCENNKEQALRCEGLLYWEMVPGNDTSKNITVKNSEKVHQFGVAANKRDGMSSGISWAECVVSPNSVDLVVTYFDIHSRTTNTADVIWQLGCAESSPLAGFIIYYCQYSPENNLCDGKEMSHNVTESSLRNVTITDELKPYTSYQIQISIVSTGGAVGRRSEKKLFTTLEDAPDPPTNLAVEKVTNSSVLLKWDLPLRKNGVIQQFQLAKSEPSKHQSEIIAVEVQNKNEIDTTYEVVNLTSSTNYVFKLQACTGERKCSNDSNVVNITTTVYKPAQVEISVVDVFNQSNAEIIWKRPLYLGAEYLYQVSVVSDDYGFKNFTRNFTDLHDERAHLLIEEFCESSKNKLKFFVRAINLNEDKNVTYAGPWSSPYSVRCDAQDPSSWTVIFITTLIFLLLGSCYFVVVFSRKAFEKPKVKVTMPPGMEPQHIADKHDTLWPPDRSNGDVPSEKPEPECSDDQTLLSKEQDDRRENYLVSSASESSDCPVLQDPQPVSSKWEDAPHLASEEYDHDITFDSDASDNNESRYSILGGTTSRSSADGYVPNHPVSPMNKGSNSAYVMLPITPAVKEPSSSYVTLADIKPPKTVFPTKENESSFINGNLPSESSINDERNPLSPENDILDNVIELSLSVTPSKVPASACYVPHKAIVNMQQII